MYVDDTQLCVEFKLNSEQDRADVVDRPERCISDCSKLHAQSCSHYIIPLGKNATNNEVQVGEVWVDRILRMWLHTWALLHKDITTSDISDVLGIVIASS